jgi:hypothetical protein
VLLALDELWAQHQLRNLRDQKLRDVVFREIRDGFSRGDGPFFDDAPLTAMGETDAADDLRRRLRKIEDELEEGIRRRVRHQPRSVGGRVECERLPLSAKHLHRLLENGNRTRLDKACIGLRRLIDDLAACGRVFARVIERAQDSFAEIGNIHETPDLKSGNLKSDIYRVIGNLPHFLAT